MYMLAECHHDMGAMDEAIGYYEKAGEIFSHHLSTEKSSLSAVKHSLALAHTLMEQPEKALQLIKESLELKKQSLPERDQGIGQSLAGLGCILCKKGDFRNALEHLQSGLSILRETIPSNNFTEGGLYSLGQTAMGLDQCAEAQQHVAECVRLCQAVYPSGHYERIAAENLLQEIVDKQLSLEGTNKKDS
jgi:tetratricopeptide (TPR) repeat protein